MLNKHETDGAGASPGTNNRKVKGADSAPFKTNEDLNMSKRTMKERSQIATNTAEDVQKEIATMPLCH